MSKENSQASGSPKLPSYFPLTLPVCKDVGELFFQCFDTKDLKECSQELAKYEKCMVKAGIESKIKLVRVPDPYRKESSQ